MPFSKKIGVDLSWAYFGYMGENDDGILEIDSNTKDNDAIFLICAMPAFQFNKIAFGTFGEPNCFDWFAGNAKDKIPSGKTFWQLNSISGDVWFVLDGYSDDIFLMSVFVGITYLVGRMHDDHTITNLCKWRYKRIKIK